MLTFQYQHFNINIQQNKQNYLFYIKVNYIT